MLSIISNSTGRSALMLKTSLVLILSLSSIMDIQASDRQSLPSTFLKSIDFEKMPQPGQTAFVASIIPNRFRRENNRVIFIPSQHDLPASMVDPRIIEAIQNSDILITESGKAEIGLKKRNPDKPFEYVLEEYPQYNKTLLRSHNLFSSTKEFMIQNKPWTDFLESRVKSFLEQATEKFRNNLPLSHMHPTLLGNVLDVLKPMWGSGNLRSKTLIGMDAKLKRSFIDQNKPVRALETRTEAMPDEKTSWAEVYIPREEYLEYTIFELTCKVLSWMISNPELDIIPKQKVLNMDKVDYTSLPKAVPLNPFDNDKLVFTAAVMERVNRRTHSWIVNIIKNLYGANCNKSIAMVVGAAHFHGSNGLFSLLSKKGFHFSPMILEPYDRKPFQKIETVKEMIEIRNNLMEEVRTRKKYPEGLNPFDLKPFDNKPFQQKEIFKEIIEIRNKAREGVLKDILFVELDTTPLELKTTLKESIKEEQVKQAFEEKSSEDDRYVFQNNLLKLLGMKENLKVHYNSIVSVEKEIISLYDSLIKAREENKMPFSVSKKLEEVIKSSERLIEAQNIFHQRQNEEIPEYLDELMPSFDINYMKIAQENVIKINDLITTTYNKLVSDIEIDRCVRNFRSFQENELPGMEIVSE